MAWALDPVQIRGQRVSIKTYSKQDALRIAEAIHHPSGWFAQYWNLDTPEKIQSMVEMAVQAHEKGSHNPLVYEVNGEVAGITRLMRLEPANKSLEIGGTWISPKWQKTFVNTEVKYLLLKHSFEDLDAERVEFRVDARNINSQRAVLRIGATLEGRMRNRQVYPDGVARDGLLFSIVRPEWERIKSKLNESIENIESRTNTIQSGSKFLSKIETEELLLRPYETPDAQAVFDLIERNREELTESFPKTFKELSSRDKAEGYITNKQHQWVTNALLCYGVFLKDSGENVGQIQIRNLNLETRSAELSYFLDRAHRSKGFGKQMVNLVSDNCLESNGIMRVYLRVLPSNQASIRLAESLGFEREGLHRKEFLSLRGELLDLLYFSKTKGAHGAI